MSQLAVMAQGPAEELERLLHVLHDGGVPARIVGPPGQNANA